MAEQGETPRRGGHAGEQEAGDNLSPWHSEAMDGPDSAIDAFGSRPDSPGTLGREHSQAMAAFNRGDTQTPAEIIAELGKVHLVSSSGDAAGDEAYVRTRDPLAVTMRLRREGRWIGQAETTRDTLMRESKSQFKDKESRQAWVYGELDRMYPPLVKAKPVVQDATTPEAATPSADSGQIVGLSEIPSAWPELPANAALNTEIGWVTANRLRIVDERPGKATRVSLAQAISPAPSWAALGWLETSIRSYAKFVDVAAKVSGTESDEGAVLKAERRSVDEVRALLAEMNEAEGTCPHCGRPL